jgi:hypothetical protein
MSLRRYDLLLAGGIIALGAWAVWAQVGNDPVGAAVQAREPSRLQIGDPLEDQDVVLGSEAKVRLHSLLGAKATVFMGWSTTCACVPIVDERLIPVIRRFKPLGVNFVAVAGDPKDTANKVASTLMGVWAEEKRSALANNRGLPLYGVLLDPTQRLCRQLGFKEATQFSVVDGNGNLRFRGTFDDDLKKPTKTFLPEALEAILEGRTPERPQRLVSRYGCPFGEPVLDCPVETP